MEFNEKLVELRKSKGLTQEELAEKLFVSRTAISKWESGRGYPNIDSLKDISKFFSVSIDDLIGSEEIAIAAEKEKKELVSKYVSLICNSLDILLAILLFIPAFRNGTESPVSVTVFGLTDISTWVKILFISLVSITILNGICGVIISNFDKPIWNKHRLTTGLILQTICVIVFVATRQPYAGIVCFVLLITKGVALIFSGNNMLTRKP